MYKIIHDVVTSGSWYFTCIKQFMMLCLLVHVILHV